MAPPRWEEKRRRVALAGRVTEAETQRPLADVAVAISASPADFEPVRAAAPQRAVAATSADGVFHFLDLPGGTYTVTASIPSAGGRYGTASAKARVTVSSEGVLTAGRLELAVPTTRIVGQVKGPGGSPVVLARVTLARENRSVVTDAEGRFTLRGVEPGARRLEVSARGFKAATLDVRVTRVGAAKTANVKLAAV